MKHFSTTIKSQDQIAKDYFCVTFAWDQSLSSPQPGQFVTIRVVNSSTPLLRRPFAFSGYNNKTREASIIYQKRGMATEILSHKKSDELLDMIGPAGNMFTVEPAVEKCIIVAGGIGLGPMLFLANNKIQMGKRVLLIAGARSFDSIPKQDIFNTIDPVICTDDGSKGFKGTTVDYLYTLKKNALKKTALYACGPMPMMKGCHDFAVINHLQCQVSMEQIMACGVGACMGCVVKTVHSSGYARVCTEGSVFNSRDILWT